MPTPRYIANRKPINSWLWMARHAIRQRNARRALEATWSALWLMGVCDE